MAPERSQISEPLIRSVSDTARWVAYHRAVESERPDRIFRDPYARRLAGERGALIGQKLNENANAIAIRTYLFDLAIRETLLSKRIEMVVNLGAGLDARPYRFELPPRLQWVEIDAPEIMEAKRYALSNEKPHCKLEEMAENLGDEGQRRILFSQLNQRCLHILIVSEGLLIYLDEAKVASLAADLHAQPHFGYWIVEVISPMLLDWMNWKWGDYLAAANARLGFAPADWREFYRSRGWKLIEFRNMAEAAHKLNREPPLMKLCRCIGELYPWWGQMLGQLWESGIAVLRRA